MTGVPLRNSQPDSVHWLGTNSIGQDLWARLWQGTRTSLLIGLAVACIQAVVGITIGVLWGYVRQLDIVFTELYNILDNIPYHHRADSGFLHDEARRGDNYIGYVADRLDRHGAIYPQPDHHYPRPRIQPCFALPGHAGLPHHPAATCCRIWSSVVMLRMALSIPEAIGSEVFITYIGLGLPLEPCPSLGNLIDGRPRR